MLNERADLVGFALSSSLKGLGRVSTLVREGVRRLLLEVLFRQSEFNRASGELVRAHEERLQVLAATVTAQLDIQTDADERLQALEQRLTRGAGAEPSSETPQERRSWLSSLVPRFEGRPDVLDAGSGRGEFLELLREAQIESIGVDPSNVLDFLRDRSESSLGGIFTRHLIDHFERAEIVEFVRLAFSRLRPDGIFVVVAHFAAVPPLALQWLVESCGFVSGEVEQPAPAEDSLVGFQEYALIARKPS